MPGMERELGTTVVGQRAIGDFDQEEHVGGGGMARLVEIGSWPQQHEVGLRFAVQTEPEWPLHTGDHLPAGGEPTDEAGEPVDLAAMRRAYGDQVDDLPLDQLDAVLARQDPGLGHPVVVVHIEQVPQRRSWALKGGPHGSGAPIVGCQSSRTRLLRQQRSLRPPAELPWPRRRRPIQPRLAVGLATNLIARADALKDAPQDPRDAVPEGRNFR